jgi:hypothetical protein
MVTVIQIRSSGQLIRLGNSLKGMSAKLPEMNSRTMMRWGKTLEKDMKVSVKEAGIKSSSGILLGKGIDYRQRPNGNVGRLFIVNHGVMLDDMKPHWVNITRSRTRLLNWARKSRNFKDEAQLISTGEMKKFPIFVKPHPFIRRGWQRARPKLNPILKQEMRKLVEEIK